MSITRTPAYTDSNGTPHATLEIAQRAEFEALIAGNSNIAQEIATRVLDVLFLNLDTVKEILRATGRKARAVKAKGNGVRKRRGKVTDKPEVPLADRPGVAL